MRPGSRPAPARGSADGLFATRTNRRFLGALLLGGLLAATATAQPTFVEVSPPADPYFVTPPTEDFWVTATAPADVDGDGDLDIAMLGFYVVYNVSAEHRLVLFLNDGPGAGGAWQFSHVEVALGDLSAGASDLAWGDFDGDGDHDLLVASSGDTVLYRNDAGVLSPLPNVLPGYWEDSNYTGTYDLRSITWADVDNDADLDLLLPSVWDPGLFEYRTALVRNDGPDGAGGWLFSEVAGGLDPTSHAQSAWADDDGDGDLDLFLTNVDPFTEVGFVRRYANDAGTFTGSDLIDLRVEYGTADWGDYDGDGDLDVLVAGNVQESDGTYNTILRVYRNEGSAFTAITLEDAPNLDWLDIHAATWADYDSDGDVDLLATGNFIGQQDIEGHSFIYANDGGTFTNLGVELPAPISSIGRGGSFTWLDIDADGDLDYFMAGAYYVPGGNGLVEARMNLYRNDAPATNQAPAAPTGLTAMPGFDGTVALSWNPAADDSTSASAITYELVLHRLGTEGALPERLPEPGGLGTSTAWTFHGLSPGTYFWSVRAVDAAYHDSAAASSAFIMVGGPPIFADGFESGDTSAWSAVVP